jgi:hypothetical protein
MHKPVEKTMKFSAFFSKKNIPEKDRKISDSDSKQEMKIFTKFQFEAQGGGQCPLTSRAWCSSYRYRIRSVTQLPAIINHVIARAIARGNPFPAMQGIALAIRPISIRLIEQLESGTTQSLPPGGSCQRSVSKN